MTKEEKKIYDHNHYLKNKIKRNYQNKQWRKKYPWKVVFNHIKERCNNSKCINYDSYGGRGIKCLITVEELKELWFRDKAYSQVQPSIDRKDNDGDYIFKNCRFIELAKNVAEKNVWVSSKPINQYDLQGNFIRSWKSAREIERKLGLVHTGISQVCNGKYKQMWGFVWKFKEE